MQTPEGHSLYLVPGVRQPGGPDVMRGEEIQLIGALDTGVKPAERINFVLPGTHSKWVTLRHGRIVDFMTLMTSELYAVLTRHSILAGDPGQPTGEPDQAAFLRGVNAVRVSGVGGAFALLFSARALVLEGKMEQGSVPDYLSGLMIGEEFRVALALGRIDPALPIHLVGEPALCARYRLAAAQFGLEALACRADSAARGLWLLATMAGITRSSARRSAEVAGD